MISKYKRDFLVITWYWPLFFFSSVAATCLVGKKRNWKEKKKTAKPQRWELFDSVLFSLKHCAILLRWPRRHKTNVPPATFRLPSSWTLSVLSPRWMCELKEFWDALHLACQASTPDPPYTPQTPRPHRRFQLRLCLAANIRPTKTRRGRSRDVLCHAIITTQPLAFRWLEGRQEVIYWQRKAAFSRRVLIHQRAEHQVCD